MDSDVPAVIEGELIEAETRPAQGMLTRDDEVGMIPTPPKESRRLLPSSVYSERARRMRIEDITKEHVDRFLIELASTGLWNVSCERAGLSMHMIRTIRKTDQEFGFMCDQAMDMFVDGVVGELVRRARDGWEEAVFSQKTGTQIGTIRKYDGKLMELLVKRYVPEFRERFESTPTVTNNVIVVPAAPSSVEAFIAAGQTVLPALPQ